MNARTARLITLSLAGACGVMALAGVLAWMGAGRGYGWLPETEAPPVTGVGRIDTEAVVMPPDSEFAEVRQRPIFNDDRKPTPIVEDVKVVDAPTAPLNITLTGIILTPDVKLAMVRDNGKNEAVSLRVGMPLPGEQAGWTLTEIRSRSVVFKNPQDETSEVELEVAPGLTVPPSARAVPPPPPPGAAPAAPPTGNAPTNVPGQPPPDRAAELQRRIEERRREMREQAEKLREQQEQVK
ncbi:MAG TPA: type II secretion system protein N [Tahibacter sp.]|uniref:type II secretion system protein N n=1 Tax=Tahibacter sp. TaxID=2056211 RepID=UPI002CB78449|nr:type II secretion system protein N [Tahibacter sp.]HSX61137.1 type II secretion system protein N [Tahibacter sp.]